MFILKCLKYLNYFFEITGFILIQLLVLLFSDDKQMIFKSFGKIKFFWHSFITPTSAFEFWHLLKCLLKRFSVVLWPPFCARWCFCYKCEYANSLNSLFSFCTQLNCQLFIDFCKQNCCTANFSHNVIHLCFYKKANSINCFSCVSA